MQDWLTAYKIPLGKWIASFVEFLNDHAAFAFNAVSDGLGFLIDGLIDLKIATSFGSGNLSAALVLALLSDGSYRKHVATLRQRLDSARSETIARLKAIGIVPWINTQAGMFLWCRLPDGVDAADVARDALAGNVVLAPGNAFSLSQTAGSFMRFNVAQSADPRIFTTLERTMKKAARRQR